MTRLEKVTNVAIIVACVAVVGNLAWNYYRSSRPAPPPPPEIAKGTVVKLPGAAPVSPQPTLAPALSKSCRFCQESVGFYQKLTAFKNSSLLLDGQNKLEEMWVGKLNDSQESHGVTPKHPLNQSSRGESVKLADSLE